MVRQGHDERVMQALQRVRRLLRSEVQGVMTCCEALEVHDCRLSGLQAVQLLQHEQLLPGEQLVVGYITLHYITLSDGP